jgi:hypothetical protein
VDSVQSADLEAERSQVVEGKQAEDDRCDDDGCAVE